MSLDFPGDFTMGDRRSGLPATRSVPPPPEAPKPPGRGGGWWVFGFAALGIFLVGRCSSGGGGGTTATNQVADASSAQSAIGNAIAAAPATPELPLSRKAAKLGRSHFKLASVEGLPGEMIYSQNCYDGLARRFSWGRLDTCGAFDQAAAASLGDEDAADSGKEVSWFEGEAAAGRYLKSAIAAGEDADMADRRLADMQALAGRSGKVVRSKTTHSSG